MPENSTAELTPCNDAIPTRLARLSSAVSRSSTISFAIFDQDFRFRAVDQVVAETHGLSVEAHIGTNIDDVIGELAAQVGPALQRVLRNDQELYFEAVGKLPNRTYTGC